MTTKGNDSIHMATVSTVLIPTYLTDLVVNCIHFSQINLIVKTVKEWQPLTIDQTI
ncbi:UNVERIFIED_CONTAM: hypothetical protein FKN15_011736 [Acipenser sinensis]